MIERRSPGALRLVFAGWPRLVPAAWVCVMLACMLVPLPTAAVDLLLSTSLAASLLLLVAGLAVRRSTDFLGFPALLLLVTLSRLALNVATTRLILSQADAGRVVDAFAGLVVRGDIVVGAVMFAVITAVQFLVIARGSERVAEVAARFALDGLPGQQAAVDADLRAGAISAEEAARRRGALLERSRFYGAMDGAARFVRGDALAGLAITAINLVGGVAVGSLRHGLALGESLALYGRLTVGDGLMKLSAHEASTGRTRGAGRASLARLALVGALLGSAGCGDPAADPNADQAAAPELPRFDDGVVRLPAAFAERIGLKTMVTELTDITPVVHVTGVLEFDEQRIAAVGSRISGRVKEVRVIEGSRVKPGDVLATLESAELGTAQADISAIEARARYADTDAARKQKLLEEGIASLRALELAMQESKVTAAELRAARQRVKALGGSAGGKALGVMSLTSPIDGDVVKVHVFRGQAVESSYTAFTIADRRSLWVRLSVFEGEVGNIRVGDTVEISAQVNAGEFLTGTVAFISTVLDPVNRSAEVRVVVPNESGTLRVGQAVNARIRPAAAARRGLAVPRVAIVQVDGKPTVFVAIDDTGVVPRPVELGVQGVDTVEVTSGLAVGDRVVVEGVFALKSELFR